MSLGVHGTSGNIDSQLRIIALLANQPRFNRELCKCDDRMPAHGAVALVMQEEDIEVGIFRGRDDRPIHIGMASWLRHRSSTDVVVVVSEVPAFFEDGSALNGRQT